MSTPRAWEKWIVQHLLHWYQENQRKLPWRDQPTPYFVLVSEFMLQQTQINTVLPYFHRFITTFPDFSSLAKANIEDVLSLWSGLGYYQRARNLHKTAQMICELYHGQFPESYEEVLRLPGVGRYTTGAILSIAFQQKVPLLDGNVIRLLTRLKRWEAPVSSLQEKLWELSTLLVQETNQPDHLNQALMELPALLCTPRAPKCLLCPLQEKCLSRGNAEHLPNKGEKKQMEQTPKIVPVVFTTKEVLLKQHKNKKHLNELFDFPWLEAKQELDDIFGNRTWENKKIIRHSIMNTQYLLHPYVLHLSRKQHKNLPQEWQWIPQSRLNRDIPLTGSGKKFLPFLLSK